MTNLILLDYASVLVFALTGALAASRAQLDLVGFMFIANLTALGGGTLRDVLLDRTPLWVAQPGFVAVASLAADPLILAAAGGLVTWALRAGSLVFGWSLPSYKSRPPRV